jgi:hypothetical protein
MGIIADARSKETLTELPTRTMQSLSLKGASAILLTAQVIAPWIVWWALSGWDQQRTILR